LSGRRKCHFTDRPLVASANAESARIVTAAHGNGRLRFEASTR